MGRNITEQNLGGEISVKQRSWGTKNNSKPHKVSALALQKNCEPVLGKDLQT